ncbi:MAG: hypothetical protein JXB50_09190, partial [Spirochaetes bacterium]|nr:hypothetical protein [Spirochaetota bacterium]
MGKIKIIFFIFILFFLIAFINCFNFDNDVIYYYSDGNANLYKIKKNFFEYKPVEELYSSTGIYSGGRYFTTKLPDEEFNVIRIYIKKAIKNKIDHINNREKGSGMIII